MMAAMAEGRMNLAALQQRDPYITDIVDTASQVALYSFSPTDNEWEKTDIEGTLFVYSRSASPTSGFMILNRLGLNDLIEPINKNLEFQLQDPFLLYRNSALAIFGIWFYDKDECARIGQLMNSLVQLEIDNHSADSAAPGGGRQRRASESDSMLERGAKLNMKPPQNVDIMQMLSKAQDEYNRSKSGAPTTGSKPKKGVEPKPMIDNPSASATRKSSSHLIKPQAMKMRSSDDDGRAGAGDPAAGPMDAASASTGGTTQISLETLFSRAVTMTTQQATAAPPVVTKSQSLNRYSASRSTSESNVGTNSNSSKDMPLILQRLMSNPGATVEEIERQHHEESSHMLASASSKMSPEYAASQQNGHRHQQQQHQRAGATPDSPNTQLKRTLNMLPQQATGAPPFATSPNLHIVGGMGDSKGAIPIRGESSLYQTSSMSAGSLSSSSVAAPSVHLQGTTQSLMTSAVLLSSSPGQNTGLLQEQQGNFSMGPQQHQQTAGSYSLLGKIDSSSNLIGSNVSTSERLITPEALTQSVSKPAVPAPVSNLQQPANPDLLLSPMAFQTPTTNRGITPPTAGSLPMPPSFHLQGSDSSEGNSPPGGVTGMAGSAGGHTDERLEVTPLTRQQMQQAMLYLLKNDPSFIVTLHDAYVKSLNCGLASWKH